MVYLQKERWVEPSHYGEHATLLNRESDMCILRCIDGFYIILLKTINFINVKKVLTELVELRTRASLTSARKDDTTRRFWIEIWRFL